MIFSQLKIKIYYVWVWFTDLSIYTVVSLQQKIRPCTDHICRLCNLTWRIARSM
jgi:hypothetical protein